MTAQDIPSSLRWDVSHAKRTLRTPEATRFLRDAYRLEAQSRRPRKRLLAWISDRILTSMPPPLPVSKSPAPPSLKVSAKRLPVSESSGHGGARPGAGRDPAPYLRKNVTLELPQPLIDKWDTHCAIHELSRAESLAKWLKWKKPGKKK